MKITYKFRDFFRIIFFVGISWVNIDTMTDLAGQIDGNIKEIIFNKVSTYHN